MVFLQYLLYMMTIEKQRQLVALLKQGDRHAFSIIYDRYWDKLYYLAFLKLRNKEATEEIVQEVFLKLWNRSHELTIHNLSHYLAAMVRYSIYRFLEKENQKASRKTKFIEEQVLAFTIDDYIENRNLISKIQELSNQLPERCRLVFQYNKLEDRALTDVADLLGISKKTAESHLTKAMKTIRIGMRSFMNLVLLSLLSNVLA